MAERPFYASGSSTQVKQFPDNEFSSMLGRIGYLYGNSPVATLSVVSSNGNAGPLLTDTRYRSGSFTQSTGDQDQFDDGLNEYDLNTGSPELITAATFDRLQRNFTIPQSLVNFDGNYYSRSVHTKPVKWDPATNTFAEMTYLECVDAFIDQWYEGQTNPSTSNPSSGGAYFVSSNASESGATLQSTTPVFVDTVANAAAYTAGQIGGAGVTLTTNNFNAATGSSSTSLYSGLIGGSGIQISFSNTSPSAVDFFGFGDFLNGGGYNSARPSGDLLAYGVGKINHNGKDQFVTSQDQFDTYIAQQSGTAATFWNSVSFDDYPVTGDKSVRDGIFHNLATSFPAGAYNNGFFTPGSAEDNTYGDMVDFDVSGADYLYMFARGDRDADTPAFAFVYLLGTNGNTELISLTSTTNLVIDGQGSGSLNGPYPYFQQNTVDRLVNAGLATSGSGNASLAGDSRNAYRIHLDGKVEKFIARVLNGRPAPTGFVFTKNTTAIATNSTGFDIETPVGTTRTAGSSFTLPVNSSGQWQLSAGTWQTSTVVGASAQTNTQSFSSVSGNGTTANVALASLGGGIDVTVTSLPGVTEEHIPPMTALDGGQFFNPNLHTNVNITDLVNISVQDIDQATRTANLANYGYRIAATYTIQQSDVGAALGFLPADPAMSSDHGPYGNTINRIVSGPFRFGDVTGAGQPGNAPLYRYNYISGGGGRVFGHNGGTNDAFGYDANGFRFFSIRQSDVGKTIVYAIQATWVGSEPHSGVINAQGQLLSGRYKGLPPEDSYYVGTGGGSYAGNVLNHPRIRIVKATDPSASNRFTAVAQNNTGFDIETPVGQTRLSGVSWNLTSNAATNAWTLAAGQYSVSAGTDTYQDHFTTTNYYLHKMDLSMQTLGDGYKTPLVIDYDSNGNAQGLRSMTYQEFDDFFEPLVKYVTTSLAGYRLSYNIDGTGLNIGDPILNQQMVGVTGQRVTRFVNVNDYRAQEFPNGVIVAQNTHRLKLEKY
jgi:hypothetical protein